MARLSKITGGDAGYFYSGSGELLLESVDLANKRLAGRLELVANGHDGPWRLRTGSSTFRSTLRSVRRRRSTDLHHATTVKGLHAPSNNQMQLMTFFRAGSISTGASVTQRTRCTIRENGLN